MNASILVMLAAPYLLFAGIVGLIYHAVRRAQRQREAAERAAESARFDQSDGSDGSDRSGAAAPARDDGVGLSSDPLP